MPQYLTCKRAYPGYEIVFISTSSCSISAFHCFHATNQITSRFGFRQGLRQRSVSREALGPRMCRAPWVLLGYIQFIMRSVLNLKRRTRETCKTRHSLIFTGQNPVRWRQIKLAGGGGKRGCIIVLQKCKIQICHGEYIKRQINILTMERKAIL
jgi:hypothetical protein